MGKEKLLATIQELAAKGLLNKDELVRAYMQGKGLKGAPPGTHWNVSRVLYYIGGAIVLIGIGVLLWQNWSSLPTSAKILSTFGSGIAAYLVAVLLSQDERFGEVAQAFHLISAFSLPIGLSITFDAAGFSLASAGVQSLMSALLFASYALSYWVFRQNLFIVFAILFGTWLYYSVATYLAQDYHARLRPDQFYEYLTLVAGTSYMLLGYFFAANKKPELAGWLYGGGALAFLGAALALGGWAPNQNLFWEIIFPGLAFGGIFLSVYLKSRAVLIVSSLYIMGYILKITGEYFTQSIGWPFALVIVGFLLIALGYFTVYLNKKYFSQ